jgi:RES domain
MVLEASSGRFPAGLLTDVLPAGNFIVRAHKADKGPIFFGPPTGSPPENRFDAPGGEYRVLYGAERLEGAFAETVLRKRTRIVRRAYVEERAWSALRLDRPLIVAKVYDEGLLRHGVDAGMIAADDYTESRELALALFRESLTLDGIAYRSRVNNGELCYALFDRVPITALTRTRTEEFTKIPARVDELMRLHGAVFDTSAPA